MDIQKAINVIDKVSTLIVGKVSEEDFIASLKERESIMRDYYLIMGYQQI